MTLGMHPFAAPTPRRAHPLRCAAVWLSVTAAALLLLAWSGPDLAAGVAATTNGSWVDLPFDRLLVELSAVALAGCATWLWVVTTLVTWQAAAGVSGVRRGIPAGLRRALLAACGVALASGLASPALASPTDATHAGHAEDSLRGLRLPDRATGGPDERSPHPVAVRVRGKPAAPRSQVTVTAGDTLWDLAAERLPTGAGDAEVAAAWRALYAANREVVGADPDLILPGEVLHLPGEEAS